MAIFWTLHGTCGYRALKEGLEGRRSRRILRNGTSRRSLKIPLDLYWRNREYSRRLAEFMKGKKQNIEMSKDFTDFKSGLLKGIKLSKFGLQFVKVGIFAYPFSFK